MRAIGASNSTMRHFAIRAVLAASLAAAAVAVPRAQPSPAPGPVFIFRQSMWLNLHHFLYVLGRAHNSEPDMTRDAVAAAPTDAETGMAALTAAERDAWRAAVDAYAAGWSRKDAVFDADLVALTRAIAAAGDAPSLSRTGIAAADAAVLERVAPLYRNAWWPAHERANATRIAELDALVHTHGAAIVAYLTRVYQQLWPAAGYAMNISAYTNWAGAYSTDGHLLMVSSKYDGIAGLKGLEIVFHEASHQWDDAQTARIAVAAARVGRPVPDGLDHAIVFYTAGEAVRRLVPDYVPYAEANGLWRRRSLAVFKTPLDTAWKPYLDGAGTLDAALEHVIRLIK